MIIYKATNTINEKVYIGLTTGKLEVRMWSHKSHAKLMRCNNYFYRAIRKYSWEAFTWEVIDSANTHEELIEKEIFWIAIYRSYMRDFGYNLTEGGEGALGLKHSEESRKKMSLARKGEKHPMYGKPVSEETRSKISQANRNNSSSLNKKLDTTKAKEIKVLLSKKVPIFEIAKLYDVKPQTIGDIKKGRTWKHVI